MPATNKNLHKLSLVCLSVRLAGFLAGWLDGWIAVCLSDIFVSSEVLQQLDFRTPFQKPSKLIIFPLAILYFGGPGAWRTFEGVLLLQSTFRPNARKRQNPAQARGLCAH